MPESPAYALGFRSVEEEHAGTSLPVEGALPDWLEGSLYRNGPGRFETAAGPVNHWFDGLAMLRRFRIDGPQDRITYTNRFLRTDAYRDAETGKSGAGQFGTAPGDGLLKRVRRQLLPEQTDNANVNVVEVADELVAVTETTAMTAVDRRTLGTRGQFSFEDEVPGQWQSAHPVRDPNRGETVNLLVDFGRSSSYELVSRRDGARRRERLASVPVEEPAYTHSFALTEQYVVLTEPPFVVDPLDLLLPHRGGDAFVDNYRWEPARGTRIRLFDRDTGDATATYRTPAMFVFHHVNAVERGEEIVVDLVGFPDDNAVDALYLDALREGTAPPRGTLWRLRLPLDGGTPRREAIASGMTLPRTNEQYLTRDHQYTWAQGQGDPEQFADRIVKAEPGGGITATWRRPGSFCGEPVVVDRPGGESPDDGAVLVVSLDPDAEECLLAVLDAATLEAHAVARLPHIVPFDFHGQFLPAPADRRGVPPR
ncbi:MAG: carotenoid oxygenase family protein [Halobacteriaceae archaeon]